jgi:hypothetical protein
MNLHVLSFFHEPSMKKTGSNLVECFHHRLVPGNHLSHGIPSSRVPEMPGGFMGSSASPGICLKCQFLPLESPGHVIFIGISRFSGKFHEFCVCSWTFQHVSFADFPVMDVPLPDSLYLLIAPFYMAMRSSNNLQTICTDNVPAQELSCNDDVA